MTVRFSMNTFKTVAKLVSPYAKAAFGYVKRNPVKVIGGALGVGVVADDINQRVTNIKEAERHAEYVRMTTAALKIQ